MMNIDKFKECAAALDQDKSSSLTEAKNALECGIFIDDGTIFESEDDAHAWIDAQRADYVTYLVSHHNVHFYLNYLELTSHIALKPICRKLLSPQISDMLSVSLASTPPM